VVPALHVDEGLKRALTDFSVIEDFESWVYEENARLSPSSISSCAPATSS